MAQSTITFSDLETLVMQKNNNMVKMKIKDHSKLTDGCNMTLVHLAAKHNNVELLKYLIAEGFEFNSKNVSGTTPVLMAAYGNHSQALNVLLEANANIFEPVQKGKTILQVILEKKRGIPLNIIADVLRHIRKRRVSATDTVRELMKVKCPLDLVLLMEDTEVMAMMLKQKNILNITEYYRLFESAIKWKYMDNVKVILDHGNGDYVSMMGYINNICSIVDARDGNLKTAKDLIQYMIDWNLYNHYWLIYALCRVFETRSKKIVKFFIENGVPEQVKKKFFIVNGVPEHLKKKFFIGVGVPEQVKKKFFVEKGVSEQVKKNLFDPMVHLFENDNFEASEFLENREFDANAVNMHGSTGLFIAVTKEHESNIEFLLERGADPNLKDKCGMTPIHYVKLPECMALLLKYGADIQIFGRKGQTIFDPRDKDKEDDDDDRETRSIKVAHLAMIKTQGVVVREEIQKIIDANSQMKRLFEKCTWQLNEMKNMTICQKITLHTVLFGEIEEFSEYIRSQVEVNMILARSREWDVHDYYMMIMEDKLSEAAKMFDLKWKAARIISNCMEIYHPGSQVVRMILKYFDVKDLEFFDCDEEDYINSF